MKNMTLENIAKACGGGLCGIRGSAAGLSVATEITGVVIDSRLILKGNLFIAAGGEKTDGHNFIAQAMEKGAICVICERIPDADIPYILVKDSFQALKAIAAFYRSQLSVTVIGITGSVGKTSTKEFIAGVLKQRYRVLKTEGNLNNEVGLPLTILKIRDEHEIAVLEMGISDFGEMHRLSAMARPDLCVMTNIGECHLEHLGSREGVLKAKSEIFDYMDEEGFVCINGDDDMLATVSVVKGKAPVSFGLGSHNGVYADDVVNKGLFGSTAMIHDESGSFPVEISLPGAHMIYNALAAVCAGRILGLTREELKAGIERVKAMKGRSNVLSLPWGILIDDCYNANPVSVKAALDLLQSAPARKVAVLGDMFQLGEGEISMHEEIGRYVLTCGTDVLICIGSLSQHTFRAAREEAVQHPGACDLYYFPDKQSFLEAAAGLIRSGDTVLLKASHGMAFETLVDEFQNNAKAFS